jgi:hypothetical protein
MNKMKIKHDILEKQNMEKLDFKFFGTCQLPIRPQNIKLLVGPYSVQNFSSREHPSWPFLNLKHH